MILINNNKPIVSIGLPVYNAEKFIQRKLDSLLEQSFTDFELIISDNASSDKTKEDVIKKCFCIDSSNLEEIFNNLDHLHDTGFSPDALLMDFKIYDSCEIDVELWHTQPANNNSSKRSMIKKITRIVPLVKLDKIIPIEMKTIPIKNSSFTQNQKRFMKYVHDDKDDVLKPIILHIPLENIFTSKDCLITEYSVTKESNE